MRGGTSTRRARREKAKVLTTYPRFAYEGVAFYAYSTQDAGTIPVYRFYHQLNGSHVYTASESEKATIIANYPVYAYEGISYYAEGNGNGGAVSLFRLYNTKLGTHFFTTNQSEANNAVAQWPWFAFEGTVYFVRAAGAPGQNVAPIVSLAASSHKRRSRHVRDADRDRGRPGRDGDQGRVLPRRRQVRRHHQGAASVRLHAGHRGHL